MCARQLLEKRGLLLLVVCISLSHHHCVKVDDGHASVQERAQAGR